jgi:hypothetical protein
MQARDRVDCRPMNAIRLLLVAALISVAACGRAPEPAPQADDTAKSPAISAIDNPPAVLPCPA